MSEREYNSISLLPNWFLIGAGGCGSNILDFLLSILFSNNVPEYITNLRELAKQRYSGWLLFDSQLEHIRDLWYPNWEYRELDSLRKQVYIALKEGLQKLVGKYRDGIKKRKTNVETTIIEEDIPKLFRDVLRKVDLNIDIEMTKTIIEPVLEVYGRSFGSILERGIDSFAWSLSAVVFDIGDKVVDWLYSSYVLEPFTGAGEDPFDSPITRHIFREFVNVLKSDGKEADIINRINKIVEIRNKGPLFLRGTADPRRTLGIIYVHGLGKGTGCGLMPFIPTMIYRGFDLGRPGSSEETYQFALSVFPGIGEAEHKIRVLNALLGFLKLWHNGIRYNTLRNFIIVDNGCVARAYILFSRIFNDFVNVYRKNIKSRIRGDIEYEGLSIMQLNSVIANLLMWIPAFKQIDFDIADFAKQEHHFGAPIVIPTIYYYDKDLISKSRGFQEDFLYIVINNLLKTTVLTEPIYNLESSVIFMEFVHDESSLLNVVKESDIKNFIKNNVGLNVVSLSVRSTNLSACLPKDHNFIIGLIFSRSFKRINDLFLDVLHMLRNAISIPTLRKIAKYLFDAYLEVDDEKLPRRKLNLDKALLYAWDRGLLQVSEERVYEFIQLAERYLSM